MSWTYHIALGEMESPTGEIFKGYSGAAGISQNNPAYCSAENVGPIPQGFWAMGTPYPDPHKGPDVIPLHPDFSTNTHKRSGFLIHGDSIAHPGHASEGCIILDRAARTALIKSADKLLVVIA